METKILSKIKYIVVTQEDIDSASDSHTSCPIATSIYRTDEIEVSVADVNIIAVSDLENVRSAIRPGKSVPHIKCTQKMKNFIKAYDTGNMEFVKPTTFTVYGR